MSMMNFGLHAISCRVADLSEAVFMNFIWLTEKRIAAAPVDPPRWEPYQDCSLSLQLGRLGKGNKGDRGRSQEFYGEAALTYT